MTTTARVKARIDVVRIVWETDEAPDLSWIGEFKNSITAAEESHAIHHRARGGDTREFEWFVSGNAYEDVSPRTRKKYIEQDYRRLLAYGETWHSVGCYAEARVSYPTQPAGTWRTETLRSGGLWGIESDSEKTYRAEVARDELADLKDHLDQFNVDTSNFDALAETAEEVAR